MYSDLKVSILGATGSVGSQTVDVVKRMGCRVKILSCSRNYRKLAEFAELLSPEILSVSDMETCDRLISLVGDKYRIICGEDALCEALLNTENDIIFHSIAGLAGAGPAVAASKTGARLAIANKEAIISLGDEIRNNISNSGGMLIPVDSEHSAVFQCLRGYDGKSDYISRILLTASGGPFYGLKYSELENIKSEDALKHPTWKMGKKITIDCATMMNKGFEVIEAVRLFGVSPEKIEVLVHRQSVVHSMVEFKDRCVLAELGSPDMRSCIQYALTYPEREYSNVTPLDFFSLRSLTFEKPDNENFPLLNTAYQAVKEGGTYPASLIAADEVAVDAFLCGDIGFTDIFKVVSTALDKCVSVKEVNLETVLSAVSETKDLTRKIVKKFN